MNGSMAIGNGGRGKGWRLVLWGGAAGLLLLPAIAMRWFPDSGVSWTGSDFVAMGVLLAAACSVIELGAFISGNTMYRAAFGIAALAGFVTVWVNLAVGMLGAENDAINLMFGGVLIVAVLGALLARFRAAGMATTMAATAGAQLLTSGVGLAMNEFSRTEIVLTALFALPWLLSAVLFRMAARRA